ncbi:response regulator transcription factor, partial [Pseudomonas protegens]|uniref:response regulator transcription factor n=1 Tax=Pseudomonas protegens TaxID=380021 RepID=UPI00382DD038
KLNLNQNHDGLPLTPDGALGRPLLHHFLGHDLHELRLRQPLLLAAGETLQTPSSAGPLENRESLLSLRELQVLQLIAQGCSNQQIAEQLFISLHTVKTHGRRIHSKLGVERRTQAVAKAQALGLMS